MKRYPGITPFRQEDASVFRGRQRETREVTNLILTQKMLVLFAKSGMGKTSLLNAGVAPQLKKYGLSLINIRFNEIGQEVKTNPVTRFMDQYRQAFVDFYADQPQPATFSSQTTLRQTLAHNQLITPEKTQIPVLVFDQFEEFFRTYPKLDQRAEFLKQLADLLSDTLHHTDPIDGQPPLPNGEAKPLNLRVVFSIRADELNQMEEVSTKIPFVLRTRYQLNPLTPEQAAKAIQEPGLVADGPDETGRIVSYETGRIVFTNEVTNDILNQLSTLRTRSVRSTDEVTNDILNGLKDAHSDDIESFQLQLVCSWIEDKFIQAAKKGVIREVVTTNDYGGSKGIEKINKEYFTDTIDDIREQPREVVIGELGKLLNDNGNRILKDESQLNLLADVLKTLVDKRILKSDKIQGISYYEISHDKIAIPLNEEKNQLEEKQRLAQERLEETKKREEEKRIEREQNKNRLLITTLIVALLIGLSAIYAWNKRTEAVNEKMKADTATAIAIRARDSATTAYKLLNTSARKLRVAYHQLNRTNLRVSWRNFDNSILLMKGKLFQQASGSLDTLDKALVLYKKAVTDDSLLARYSQLAKLVAQAQRVCAKMEPIQKLLDDANRLEQGYYLSCANDRYVLAEKAQQRVNNSYKNYYFPDGFLTSRVALTDSVMRDLILTGIQMKSDLYRNKISHPIISSQTSITNRQCSGNLIKKKRI